MLSAFFRLAALTVVLGLMSLRHGVASSLPRFLPPSIPLPSVEVVRESCSSRRITVGLRLAQQDVGKPGVVYVAVHDDSQTRAFFLTAAGWVPWQGGMFPIHTVARDGLRNTTIQVPDPHLIGMDEGFTQWNLLVGYGALSEADERLVQRYVQGVELAKTRSQGGPAHAVHPDQFRLALVQKDLTDNGKYQVALRWDSAAYVNAHSPFCSEY